MARKRASPREAIGKIRGARAVSLPAFVEPELATLVEDPPAGDTLHEMKLDGYRILCRIDSGAVKLYSRNRND